MSTRIFGKLYVHVLIGVLAGGLLGCVHPRLSTDLTPFGDVFIQRITMVFATAIFAITVLGIACMHRILDSHEVAPLAKPGEATPAPVDLYIYTAVISHRSGETEGATIADIAVGLKTPSRSRPARCRVRSAWPSTTSCCASKKTSAMLRVTPAATPFTAAEAWSEASLTIAPGSRSGSGLITIREALQEEYEKVFIQSGVARNRKLETASLI